MKIEDFGGEDLDAVRKLALSIGEAASLLGAVSVHASWDTSTISDWLMVLKDELELADEEIWGLIHEVHGERT